VNGVHQAISLQELRHLLVRIFSGDALGEWGLLLGCLGLALLLSWGLRRLLFSQHARGSVMFGRRIVDGALFPLLAMGFAFTARRLLPELGLSPALFKLALPVLVSLAVIRLIARVLAAAWPQSALIKAVERLGSWLVWVLAVLWVTGLLPVILDELDDIEWKFGSVHLTARNLLEGGLTAVIVLVTALWISSAVEAQLMRRESMDLSTRKIAANVIRALLLFVGLLFALSAAGIDLTALGVLGGALGVGIGFGLQKLAANYVSGFVILAERSLRIGDMVKVDGFEGRVTDIKTRYTVIRSAAGREAIVPNEMLITQRDLRAGHEEEDAASEVEHAVDGDDGQSGGGKTVGQAVVQVPRVLADPGPAVQLSQFAADGLELTLYFWINDPENGLLGLRSEVNLAILRTLNRLGVGIPYPQRVLRGDGLPMMVAPSPQAGPTGGAAPAA